MANPVELAVSVLDHGGDVVGTTTVPIHDNTTWREAILLARASVVIPAMDSMLVVRCVTRACPSGYVVTTLGSRISDASAQDGIAMLVSVDLGTVTDLYRCARSWRRVQMPEEKADFVQMSRHGRLKVVMLPTMVNFEPRVHFFRNSEDAVLEALRAHARNEARYRPLVLLGSPGVGKSCLARLFAVELNNESKDVLYIHFDRTEGSVTVMFLRQSRDYIFGSISLADVPSVLELFEVIEGRPLSPFVIIDGYSNLNWPLPRRCDLLVASGGFNAGGEYPNVLMLPSWAKEDVDDIIATMFPTAEDAMRKRYGFYGGNLRQIFAEDQEQAIVELHLALDHVNETNVDVLLSPHARVSPLQVDAFHRCHVEDPSNPAHYRNPLYWSATVESLYVRRRLAGLSSFDWFDSLIRHAKGTPLYGNAYEMTAHCHAARTTSLAFDGIRLLAPTINHDEVAVPVPDAELRRSSIRINTRTAICEGMTVATASDAMLKVLGDTATYFSPALPNYPFVDAVAQAEWKIARRHHGDVLEGDGDANVIALIQYTVGRRKTVNVAHLQAIVDRLEALTMLPIVLVYVTPPDVLLTVTNVPPGITTMVAHYDATRPPRP